MIFIKRYLCIFFIGISAGWSLPVIAGDQAKSITENDCARLQRSEIIWHLSENQWLCCIPKNEEEYETCIPISDMKPPPKTGIKSFPPSTTKTIKPEKQ